MVAVPSLSGLVPTRFHIFHLSRPCPAEMALKMGALQFSYVKPCTRSRSYSYCEPGSQVPSGDILIGPPCKME
jgi:hypothetical protein